MKNEFLSGSDLDDVFRFAVVVPGILGTAERFRWLVVRAAAMAGWHLSLMESSGDKKPGAFYVKTPLADVRGSFKFVRRDERLLGCWSLETVTNRPSQPPLFQEIHRFLLDAEGHFSWTPSQAIDVRTNPQLKIEKFLEKLILFINSAVFRGLPVTV